MKKLILVFAVFCASLTAAQAQLSFGPKVGVNVSNYTGGDIESNALVGFHLGGMLNLAVGKTLSIQPEVLFSTQGAKVQNNGEKKEFKTTYVTVPVMVKFRANNGLYFELGPQAGFKTSENIPDQTIDNFAKNLDLAGAVGLGFQAAGGFGLGARYVAGFSKVGDFDKTNIDPDFKNSVIQVSVFYLIGTKR